MNKLKRYIIGLLIFISCHSIEAGWRDWFSWSSWKQWFSTSRIAKWFYGQSPEQIKPVITKTAVTAFQQRPAAPPASETPTPRGSASDIQSKLNSLFDQNLTMTEFVSIYPLKKNTPIIQQYEKDAAAAAEALLANQSADIPILPNEVLEWEKSSPPRALSSTQLLEQLHSAIANFLKNAEPFFKEVRKMYYAFNPIQLEGVPPANNFDSFFAQYKNFINDVDSIQIIMIPRSIANIVALFKNGALENKKDDTFAAFSLLHSSLPWEYLINTQTIQEKEFPIPVIKGFASYVTNNYPKIIDDYVNELNTATEGSSPAKRIPLPAYKNMDQVLALLRKYKLYLDYNLLFGYRNRFAQAIQKIDPTSNTAWITKFGEQS